MSALAREPDAAAEAEALHRRDHRDFAVVDGGERFVAPSVDADRATAWSSSAASSLMSTPAWKPLPSARRITTCTSGSRPGRAHRVGELEPARDRERVHRRIVDGDDRDPVTHFGTDHAAEHTSGMVSLWSATHDAPARRRDRRSPGDVDADVAIVGAGYTGLWTAYAAAPGRSRVARRRVRTARRVGFGASGRNGGWCSAFFAGRRARRREAHGRDAAIAMQRAMFATLDEIERVVTRTKRSTATGRAAERSRSRRLPAHVAASAARARRPPRVRVRRGRLPAGSMPTEVAASASAAARTSARCTPRTARRSTRRSSSTGSRRRPNARASRSTSTRRSVEIAPRRGADGARDDASRRRRARHRGVHADIAGTATRARADLLADDRDRTAARRVLGRRRTRTTARRSPTRAGSSSTASAPPTAASRSAAAARPYHFGSRVRPRSTRNPRVFDGAASRRCGRCSRTSVGARSRTAGAARSECRATGIRRSGFDRATGMAWAGGYVGDGVSTTNLAGRTLADLILGRDTDITRLPWVGHVSPRWEPEPLRWLGINAGAAARDVDRPGRSAGPRRRRGGRGSPRRGCSAADRERFSRRPASAGVAVRGARRCVRATAAA